jgi:hypothetical protein
MAALSCLDEAVSNNRMQGEVLVSIGAFSYVTSCVKRYMDSGEICKLAASILISVFLVHDDDIDSLLADALAAGAINTFVQALEKHKDAREVCDEVCWVLSMLICEAEHASLFIQAGGLNAICAALTRHDSILLSNTAFGIACRVCLLDNENAYIWSECGGMQCIVDALNRPCSDVVRNAARCLRFVCNPITCADFCARVGVVALVSALHTASDSSSCVWILLDAIEIVSRVCPSVQSRVLEYDGIRAMQDAALPFIDEDRIQSSLLKAIMAVYDGAHGILMAAPELHATVLLTPATDGTPCE